MSTLKKNKRLFKKRNYPMYIFICSTLKKNYADISHLHSFCNAMQFQRLAHKIRPTK